MQLKRCTDVVQCFCVVRQGEMIFGKYDILTICANISTCNELEKRGKLYKNPGLLCRQLMTAGPQDLLVSFNIKEERI